MNRLQASVGPAGIFIELHAENDAERHIRSLARHLLEQKVESFCYGAIGQLAALRISVCGGGERLERDLVFGISLGLAAVWAIRSEFQFAVESSQESYMSEGWVLSEKGWEREA